MRLLGLKATNVTRRLRANFNVREMTLTRRYNSHNKSVSVPRLSRDIRMHCFVSELQLEYFYA